MADDLDPAAVERAARAGYDASRDAAETEPWDDLPEWGRETFRAFTRAALAARQPAPVVSAEQVERAHDCATEVVARRHAAAEVNPTPLERAADGFTADDELNRLAVVLMRAWAKADPRSAVAQHPASFVATFADMARAALAAAGPLVTPEHDAQVAARALREAATALRGTSSKTYAEAWLITRADRIERQEGGR